MRSNTEGSADTYTVDYWQGHHLTYDPFLANTESDCELLPSWQSHLELLQHLVNYRNVLIVISGPTDSGKSMFMQYVQQQFCSERFVISLSAHGALNGMQLLQHIRNACELPQHLEHSDTFIDSFLRQLTHWLGNDQRLLLLIDDAEQLSSDALNTVLELIRRQSHSAARLHIVLFASPEIEPHLAEIKQQQLEASVLLHQLELQPLNLAEIEQYLAKRMQDAGWEGALPFTAVDITRISQDSDGYIGRINQLARQILLKQWRQQMDDTPQDRQTWQRSLMYIGFVSLLVVAVMAITIYRTGQTEKVSEGAFPFEESLPEITKKLLPTEDMLSERDQRRVIQEVTEQARLNTQINIPPQVITDKKSAPVVAVEEHEKEVSQDVMHLLTGQEQHILAMPSTKYTVQLLGTHSLQAMQDFIAQQNLTDAWYFKTQRNGRDWYVLVHGSYASRKEAMQAAEQLPIALQKLKPWARNLSGVQQAIRKQVA